MRALRFVVVALVVLGFGWGTPADAKTKKKKPKKPVVEQPEEKPPEPVEPPDARPVPAAPAEEKPAPAPVPAPKPAAPPVDPDAETNEAANAVDVDALRQQYEKVREKLFTSRATASAVGDTLYNARIRIHLRYGSTRFWALKRVTIRLDGANVYDDASGAIAADDAPRFETFVAPGKHVVTIRIEAQSKDDERIMTTTESSFVVDAPERKLTLVRGKAEDGGDIGWSWKRKSRGSYKLRLDVGVEAKDLKQEGDADK